jgi:hypothetical protein
MTDNVDDVLHCVEMNVILIDWFFNIVSRKSDIFDDNLIEFSQIWHV